MSPTAKKTEKKAPASTKVAVEAKGKTLMGVVTSISMKDTVAVAVSRYVKHPKYKKYMKRTKKFLVHAPAHTVSVGDRATIQECRPISKNKHFTLVSVVKGRALETDSLDI